MSEERVEFRPRPNGEFDEIVARFKDGMVHVETMSGTGCYVGFYWDDGHQLQWWINSTRKLTYHHEQSRADRVAPVPATDLRAEGYAQAERDIVAWMKSMPRKEAMALWMIYAKQTMNKIATAIAQGSHRHAPPPHQDKDSE